MAVMIAGTTNLLPMRCFVIAIFMLSIRLCAENQG
jgi:hypothetical protein